MKKATDEINRIKKMQAEDTPHRIEKSYKKPLAAAQRNSQRQEEITDQTDHMQQMPTDTGERRDLELNLHQKRKSSSTCRSAVSKSMKQEKTDITPYCSGLPDSFRADRRSEFEKANTVPEIPLANIQERFTANWGERDHLKERAQTQPATSLPNPQDIDEYIQMRINEKRRKDDDQFIEMLKGHKPVELDSILTRQQSQYLKAREETIKAHNLLDLEIKSRGPEPKLFARSALSDFAVQTEAHDDSKHHSDINRPQLRVAGQSNPFHSSSDANNFNRDFEVYPKTKEVQEDSIKLLATSNQQPKIGMRANSLTQVNQSAKEVDLASSQMAHERPAFLKISQDPYSGFGKKGSSQTGQSMISSHQISPKTQNIHNFSSLATPPLTSDRHYQNLIRTNQSLPTSSQDSPLGSKLLAEVFSEMQGDDQKTLNLKSERQQVLRRVQESDSKLPVINSLIARLTSVCPRLIELGVLWRDSLVCGQSQIDFLEGLKSMQISEMRERTNLEIDYWTSFKMRNDESLSKLRKRDTIRGRIASIALEFESLRQIEDFNRATSSCFNVLRAVDKNLVKRNKELLYKGLKIDSLIKLDLFEEEQLRKIEQRINARDKYF